MEPALKQRLIGAAVLVALAVIFLPMLIKGPAPESGASDVPLELPPAPEGGFETRELPLVAPAETPEGGALGMPPAPAQLPTVDTTTAADPGEASAAPGEDAATPAGSEMTPPPVEGGDYAVSFGAYATRADAARVVDALRSSQLPGYQEAADEDGRTLFRVRIGPYADRATAETARLRAAHVRDDVGSRVLNIAQTAQDQPVREAPGDTATATAAAEDEQPAEPASEPAAEPATQPAEPARPAAAAGVGFAVQIGAFGVEANATRLRDRARELGFTAFVVNEPTAQGTLSAVKVGPVADRAAAEALKAKVAARMGITGTIGSHP